ncbi:carbohydrate sulfotransferase 10-like [Lingula anatina]|uniref:Carbohydrate sulfotransferase n=1 Tax=Lingula anatina TaxID=7574 RepID=A0A1S3IRL0_LINAN|nr:carbohydrate sulfotransferase 10-like [Lingula anatina]|eukprot:XP_013400850.1 carbohydrate sulfotransferase 10-like [Lingula anatina]
MVLRLECPPLEREDVHGLQWDRVPVEWKEIMNRRRQMLHQMCKDLNETTNTDTPIIVSKHDITDRVIVDDLHRVIVCAIPKAASRSWRKLMLQLNGQLNTSVVYKDMPYTETKIYERRLDSYTDFGIHTRVNSHIKIMTVRHPLVRLVSAYKEQYFLMPRVRKYIRRREGETRKITFTDFLYYLVGHRNIHWDPFNKLCSPCKLRYDFVAYFETIEDDTKNIIALLGADDLIKLSPSHRSSKLSSDDEARKYYAGIDKQLLKRLKELYWIEEKYFGYNMSLFG